MSVDRVVPDWRGPRRVHAFFSARHADADAVHAALPGEPVRLWQVHGREVSIVDNANLDRLRTAPPQADAAVTRLPGVVLSVRTADCLPVLFADRAGTVVGVAHAGWRGLATGVLEATIAALAAHDLVAWIGPCIGPRAFEVGRDVHDVYCRADEENVRHFAPLREGKWLADLPALARRRLAAAGVHAVDGGTWCTYSDPASFHSYRRDGTTGRMALYAWLAPDALL
ncbi:MAG: peptidoglycan editing factor PgeF [Burkholderiales bacterium]|nr:peptidoglycan editing factor PgeF [Burkholderiales bacterium]